MNQELFEYLRKNVKPMLMKKAEADIDVMVSEIAKAVIGTHNRAVDGCVTMADAILNREPLTGNARQLIELLRDHMAKFRE